MWHGTSLLCSTGLQLQNYFILGYMCEKFAAEQVSTNKSTHAAQPQQVRLVEHGQPTAKYFAVSGCVPADSGVRNPPVPCTGGTSATRELTDGGALFHTNLYAHCAWWMDFHAGAAGGSDGDKGKSEDNGSNASSGGGGGEAMSILLNYDASEGARLYDMARGTYV